MIEHFVTWYDEHGTPLGRLHVKPDGSIEIWTSDETYGTTIDVDAARDVADAIFTAQREKTCPRCGLAAPKNGLST